MDIHVHESRNSSSNVNNFYISYSTIFRPFFVGARVAPFCAILPQPFHLISPEKKLSERH
jgi:hypothetical protein